MMISCSRRTDIPAFYSNWFFNRLSEQYVQVANPVNPGQIRKVSLAREDVDGIVFWTKNPAPMINRLHLLKDYPYYFLFTLTPYGRDIEPNLPPKSDLVETFLRLSEKIGKKRVVWRYDPIFLTDALSVEYHINHFGELALRLAGYSEKCVISFLDLYRHIQNRMASLSVRVPDETEILEFAGQIAGIARNAGMKVETCAERIDLSFAGISHGKCIDDILISELTGIKFHAGKDKGQRKSCGCVASADIGQYNTCAHLCKYCYANTGKQNVEKRMSLHNSSSPALTG
ncbi:MAG TPA: DUF1848 domain-containing protein [Smithellaceae bacterium]|jgi:hypothetical protein|nr:DUF1848 domain-containing protein [Smithellaceae bacterium]